MEDIESSLKNIFTQESAIQAKRDELTKDLDLLYDKKCKIAFDLYTEFKLKNIATLDRCIIYYYLHIESNNFCSAEEVVYKRKSTSNLIEFEQHSIHRQGRVVSLYLDVKEEDYTRSSVIIDKEMFDTLSEHFKLKIRM